jgi:predicted DNA-binding transcriptional regulator AlpA
MEIKKDVSLNEFQAQLNRIEAGLIAQKQVLTFSEWCKYCGFSESYGYKISSQGKAPGMSKPNGKMLYFSKEITNSWLLQNPIKTADAIEKEAVSYVTLNKEGRAA